MTERFTWQEPVMGAPLGTDTPSAIHLATCCAKVRETRRRAGTEGRAEEMAESEALTESVMLGHPDALALVLA
jgi:hypothetical protein